MQVEGPANLFPPKVYQIPELYATVADLKALANVMELAEEGIEDTIHGDNGNVFRSIKGYSIMTIVREKDDQQQVLTRVVLDDGD